MLPAVVTVLCGYLIVPFHSSGHHRRRAKWGPNMSGESRGMDQNGLYVLAVGFNEINFVTVKRESVFSFYYE